MQGENERQWKKKKVNKDDTYDTSSVKRETSCNQEVSESVKL